MLENSSLKLNSSQKKNFQNYVKLSVYNILFKTEKKRKFTCQSSFFYLDQPIKMNNE